MNTNLITQALTDETPGKVMALVGTAMFSLAFMLSVSVSNASFTQTYEPVSDPFSMQNVVATIDNVAGSYSSFLATYLFEPAYETYAIHTQNLGWVMEESGLAYALGFESSSEAPAISSGRVAGASTSNIYYYEYPVKQESAGVLDVVFSVLQ